MTPHLIVVDDAIPSFEFAMLGDYCKLLTYEDRKGPDGSTYAGISDRVPGSIIESLTYGLSWIMGYRVAIKICAFRLSVMGTQPPQWAHSDLEAARWASFVYINEGPAATAILRHRETGLDRHPQNEDELEVLHRDQNRMEAWEIVGQVEGKPNRMIVLPSHLIHAALPFYGFGSGPADGRLILWTFFD